MNSQDQDNHKNDHDAETHQATNQGVHNESQSQENDEQNIGSEAQNQLLDAPIGSDLHPQQQVSDAHDDNSPHNQESQDNNEAEEQGEPNNEGSGEDTISNLISSVSNSHLLSEENIEAIREVLCKKENVFYKLSPGDKNLHEELLTIIKLKARIAENTIGQALNYYHQKLLDSELNHLDKLMKILKSNKREMYLCRLRVENSRDNRDGLNEHDSEYMKSGKEESFPLSQTDKRIGQSQTSKAGYSGVSLRDLLPEYDTQRKFIRFQLNDKYEVYLKAFEEKNVRKHSLIDKVPQDVLQNHIFIYFNSFDLFKLRAVCSEWRELIRGMWHIIFRREMMEQVIAADLCNDIELNFKLMSVKSPFYQKFGIFMKAISEIIDWDNFQSSLISETGDARYKMLVMTFFRMIGMNVGLDKLSEFQEANWEYFKEIAANHLRTFIDPLFHQEFRFKSNYELDLIKENFLDCPDISSFNIRQSENKNAIMFQLFLRQLLVFAQLKNYISLAQNYILVAKDKLKEVSKEWPHKKDFLEGAYKILLFKFVEIKNGEVVIVKEDNDRKSGLLRNIQDELDECMNITTSIHDDEEESQHLNEQKHTNMSESKLQKEEHTTQEASINAEPSTEQLQTGDQIIKNEGTSLDTEYKSPQNNAESSQDAKEHITNNDEHDKAEDDKKEINLKDETQPNPRKRKCNLNEQLAKIVQMKTNDSNHTLERFLNSKDPDYLIRRNGSETRLYLDDIIRIEFLIQKVLKQHIMYEEHDCDCPLHARNDNEEDIVDEHPEDQQNDSNNVDQDNHESSDK